MSVRSAGFHHAAVRGARLLQQKKHRLQRRCFLVEGPLVLAAAFDGDAVVEQIFMLHGAALSEEVQSRVARAAEIWSVDVRTLESLAQTASPQSVVGVVRFVHEPVERLPSRLPASGPVLVVTMPDIADPGNAGTLIRSADAFGAAAVCFGPTAVEPYNDKVVRASMGALFRVPIFEYANWAQLVGALREARLSVIAAEPSGQDIRRFQAPERAALLIGQERRGLGDIPRSDIDASVAVPQASGVDSLNAAVAGSIVMYEFARSRGTNAP